MLPIKEPVGTPSDRSWDLRVRLWMSRRQRAQELKNLYEATWVQYWKWYRNEVERMNDPADWWRSNEAVPTPFKIVETLLPRYIMGMFDSPDYFTVESRNRRNEMYEHLIYNLLRQVMEEMAIFPKLYEAMRYATVMGHAWGKMTWREEYSERQVMEPVELTIREAAQEMFGDEGLAEVTDMYGPEMLDQPSGQMGLRATIREEEDFNGPDFDWRTLDRIFPDPTGRMRWVIEEIDTTIEELREIQDQMKVYDQTAIDALSYDIATSNNYMKGMYGGLDNLGDARSGTSAGVSVEYSREPESTEGIPDWITSNMREGVGVKLWQCWGWVPPHLRTNDSAAWRLTVIAEGKWVLRDDPAPTPDGRPPYFPIKSIALPGVLYGDSILRYVGPLADQQTRLANMRLDEVYLGVWQQYLFRKNSVVSDNAMLMQPGGAIEVNPEPTQSITDTFMVLPRRDVLPSVWQEDTYRQTQAEHVAAATDIIQGVGSGDRTTATEIERQLQQGNARHILQVMWNDYTVLKEVLTRTFKLLQMRLTAPKMTKIYGDEYGEITLQDIQMPVDITVGGGIFALSKENRVQMDMELVEMLRDPELKQWFKVDAVLKKWMVDRGWKHPESYLITQEDMYAQNYALGMAQAASQFAQQDFASAGGAMAPQAGAGAPGEGGAPQAEGAQGQGGPPNGASKPGMPEMPYPGNAASVVGSPLASGQTPSAAV